MLRVALITLAAAFVSVSAASAATVTRSYEFFATGFGAGAPVANVSGHFSVTFDPAVNTNNGTLNDLTISGLPFTTANSGFSVTSGGFMTVGGTVSGIGSVSTSASDFAITFLNANSSSFTYLPLNFTYSNGTGRTWSTSEFQISPYVAPPAPVPEPATWAMMIAGFGLTGMALRHRRREAWAV